MSAAVWHRGKRAPSEPDTDVFAPDPKHKLGRREIAKNEDRVWHSKPRKSAKRAKAGTSSRGRAGAPKGPQLELTNPDKVLYPEKRITKSELADYYAKVAGHMLPHVAGRPLTLVRCPEGRHKGCFFQKHIGAGTPEFIRAIPIREEEGFSQYMAIDDVMGLMSLVQLGVLEVHTWGAASDDPEHPDLLVIDLDPDPAVSWGRVVERRGWCALDSTIWGSKASSKRRAARGCTFVFRWLRGSIGTQQNSFASGLPS